ncbi:MAG: TonB-dependent receptor [Chitinophagaceae bacterium]|nr:TonB-dependent receptor [Chitinophagaceae bacterium]
MSNKKFVTLIIYLACCLTALVGQAGMAQDRVVNGIVTDINGSPVAGVSVQVSGESRGVATGADGSYSISGMRVGATLVFSSVGYKTQRVVVGSATVYNITFLSDAVSLDEVVAIGYGTVKKSDLTGSVSSVKGKDLNAFPAANVVQALSGRAAGVQVKVNTGAPGGAASVRIRGTNSIQGINEPLYVIDGFPVNNALALNNADIENIEILKDASAIAIYGSRGANGVVLITTKKGKSGATRVDFETSYGFQDLRRKLELMNAEEYAKFYNEQRLNDGQAAYFSDADIAKFGKGFDWQDFVYQTAPIRSHSLTVSGGNAKTQFAVSGTLFDQEGIIRGSDYQRYALRASISHTISDKFSIDYSSVLSRNTTSQQNSGGARFGASLISASLVAPPTLTPYNDDGSYRVLSTAYPFVSEGLTNPLNFINEITDRAISNKVLAHASVSYKPIEELTLKVYGGVENSDDRSDYYRTLRYFNSTGNATVSTGQYTSILNENTLTYDKSFNEKHHLTAVAGFTYQDFVSKTLGGSGSGFLSDVTETYGLGGAAVPGIPSSSYSKSVLLSSLARVNYVFDNRILATLSFRADGSSKFSEGDKWGYFPSAALAWKIKEERFLKSNETISDLKIRASWGATGSQAIGAYATLNQLSSGKTVFGDNLYNIMSPSTRLPGRLKWETTEQADIGIDLGLLHNKIRITADYYNKVTRDLLNTVQLPSSLGFTSTIQNVGKIRNSGFEFTADVNVLNRDFVWNLSGNIAFNKSKVLKLYGGQDILGGYVDMLIFADNVNLLREGLPMGVFYGYQEDGYTSEGKIAFKDMNGDGLINLNDKSVIGDPNPDFLYGINSVMSFKGFDLSIFFQGSQGNDLVNISSVGNTLHYGYGDNMLKEVFYDHWSPTNTNAKYPKISRTQTLFFSNRYVEDGSYLRLRNIEAAYNIPVRASWIRNARIYVSGQNLLTITKYSWWDPEVNSMGGSSPLGQGIDFSTYPTAKSVTFGVQLGF